MLRNQTHYQLPTSARPAGQLSADHVRTRHGNGIVSAAIHGAARGACAGGAVIADAAGDEAAVGHRRLRGHALLQLRESSQKLLC